MIFLTLLAPLGGVPMSWMRSPSPMLSPIGERGSSDAYGSWKMICIRRRNGFSLLARDMP